MACRAERINCTANTMAGILEKFQSLGKGNGVRALKDMSHGLTVIRAVPYVYTVCRKKSACDYCLHRKEKLLRCSQCKVARYCNAHCQREAWQSHKRECKCLRSTLPNVPTDSVRLVGKIIFKMLQNPDATSEELYTISDLQSHIKEASEEVQDGLRHLATALQLYLKEEIQDISQLPPGFQAIEYFGKVTCNSFTISDGEMQDVGVGLYPSMSLLNHSCDPNCVIVFEGTCLLLRTVKEIPKGEELTISYIDVKMPTQGRRDQLQRQYSFTCDCHRCLIRDKDEDMLAGDADTSREVERSVSRLEELLSQNKAEEALNLCKTLMNRYYLPDKNIHQLKVLDCAMDACINLGLWEEALQFGLQTLEPYSLYYSNYHPVRAVQLMKVGKLQNYQGLFTEATKTLMQAFDIMKVTHGRDHNQTQQLAELLNDCEANMRGM
ncbi:histone-lysine N-methyltransferase SMYD3 isoform X2 [Xenopus laevis]|uniref:[histone H3]-lysine(4) N-trimethyltransferase n=1 Tax=Xenopus laevis TaxID=8355 RepID=A0A8J1KMZ3_XENLA|nr:histone-lysine N-methyltransferase SMYD3 isoform X2 [Xenopus laevis]